MLIMYLFISLIRLEKLGIGRFVFCHLRFCVASLILTDHQEFLALFCPGMGHKSAIDDSNLGWFSGEWVRFKLTFGHAE